MRLGVAAAVSVMAPVLAPAPARAQTPPTVTSTLPARINRVQRRLQ